MRGRRVKLLYTMSDNDTWMLLDHTHTHIYFFIQQVKRDVQDKT
jgi:hypothetical protein